jgi:hypothetical protein
VFAQLAAALGEMPEVVLGRRFGCWCLKLGRHPFIALTRDRIAFRVGLEASDLVHRFPQARLWNPRNGRQPKRCWVTYPAGNPEAIASLGALAYGCAVTGAVRTKGDAAAQ